MGVHPLTDIPNLHPERRMVDKVAILDQFWLGLQWRKLFDMLVCRIQPLTVWTRLVSHALTLHKKSYDRGDHARISVSDLQSAHSSHIERAEVIAPASRQSLVPFPLGRMIRRASY